MVEAKTKRLVEEFRKRLELYPWGHLCAIDLASYLGVSVCQKTEYGFDSGVMERLQGWDTKAHTQKPQSPYLLFHQEEVRHILR